MKKMTIFIDDDMDYVLRMLADAEHATLGEIVGDAVLRDLRQRNTVPVILSEQRARRVG